MTSTDIPIKATYGDGLRNDMKRRHPATHRIELRLVTLSQLFNSMDPTPFHHRDLDRDAVEFLESWALEFPQGSRFCIVVYIEKMPPEDPGSLVTEAMHNYFEYESTLAKRNVRLMLAEGRTSLLIGLAFLAICLLGADLLTLLATNAFLRTLKESLVIGGWVAMWRPMQIFLYDWWPVMRKHRIYRNLASARVQVLPARS